MGKIRAPFYRVVVMDSRAKRDGRAIEEIGKYHPTAEPSLIDIDSDRAQHWLSVGAQPTEQVQALLKVTGDWAKFTGEGDPAGSLRSVAEPRDKKALYEAALAAADGSESSSPATARSSKKSVPPKQDGPTPAEADNVSSDPSAVVDSGSSEASSDDEATASQV